MNARNLALAGMLAAVAAGAIAPAPALAQGGPAERVTVCHQTGNGRYQPLTINGNALDAHLRHGDALPGATVAGGPLNAECQQQQAETIRVESPPMAFGPYGWGGISCPVGTIAVSGGYEPAGAALPVSQLALPGSVFPHYVFGPQESGWVVQNGPFPQTVIAYVNCRYP